MSLARYLSKITQLLNSSGQVLTGGIADSAVTIGKVDTSVSQLFGMRNRIINGAMMIDQRNAGASVTQGIQYTFAVDRTHVVGSVTSKMTVQQNAGSVTPPAGFTNYLGVTSSSSYSVTTNDYFVLRQNIEGYNIADFGWGTANAQPVTLSFWVRSSLTGTFGVSLRNSSVNRTFLATYTVNQANTWEYKTITIVGETTGTWGTTNNVGIYLQFGLGVGSSLCGSATGSWANANYDGVTGATSVVGTNGATFYITGVQLEKGSTATSFDYRPYGTELALCQRYYEQLNAGEGPSNNNPTDSTRAAYINYCWKQRMRVTPTVSVGGADGIFSNSAVAVTAFKVVTTTSAWSMGLTTASAEL